MGYGLYTWLSPDELAPVIPTEVIIPYTEMAILDTTMNPLEKGCSWGPFLEALSPSSKRQLFTKATDKNDLETFQSINAKIEKNLGKLNPQDVNNASKWLKSILDESELQYLFIQALSQEDNSIIKEFWVVLYTGFL